MDVGKRIRECRNKKGLSQEALAKLINKSMQVISNWERGYTPNISHEDLSALGNALDVSVDYLLGNSSINKVPSFSDPKANELYQKITSLSEDKRRTAEVLIDELLRMDGKS